MELEQVPAAATESRREDFSKPTQPKHQETEVNVDRDAVMLKGVLDAADAANLAKQMLQVGAPITEGMAAALLGESGRNLTSVEIFARDDPRHELLTHLPARTMITTEAALQAEVAFKTTALVSQTASTRVMSPV